MCQWPGSLYDLGPVQHRLAPVEGETCSLSGQQCTGLRASSPPGWPSLHGASVSLCTVGRAPLRETQPCPGKPSPCLAEPEACFPCTESSNLAVAGQALVVGASLMGIMKPWKPLEASQVAETGGREVPGLLGHLEEAKATHVGGGVTGSIQDPLPSPSQCQTPAEPPWRE